MEFLHSDGVVDVATSSNFKDVKTSHLHLDLEVNMAKQKIVVTAELTFKCLKDGLKTVTLDVHETMLFSQVRIKKTGKSVPFGIKPFADYGTSMVIELPEAKNKGDEFVIAIDVVATSSPGVCFLDPLQTADKTTPFMYTQGQSVLNRCFFPCQDTPAIKAPYSAFVKVPEGMKAVMSANFSSFGERENLAGTKDCYYFEQTVPIQSYLVALAVGNIESAPIGPRSCVWAEPSVLPRAKAEFEGIVEEYIQTGEKLFGDYVWGRYDILIMPPSFPFGGMENPCLTFVTPCIIVGDKSLTDVVIHEITHSWFGNLVTNANWSEFWLNEGFTMYCQRRIEEKVFGRPYTCLEASTGLALLRRHIEREGQDHPLTKLRVEIAPGVDPDDTYNETPYEKGYIFLCYLQSLVGDHATFDDFLKSYVKKFAYKSIVAEDFFDYFLDYFPHLKEQRVHERPNFEFTETWLNAPGWPPFTPDLSDGEELTGPAERVAEIFSTSDGKFSEVPDVSKWKTFQVLHFLDNLVEKSPLPPSCMDKLGELLPFLSASENAEIQLRWCEVVIRNNALKFTGDIRRFLKSQGKQKYTKPLYQTMAKATKDFQSLAFSIFAETKDHLHPNVFGYVEEALATISS